MAKSELVRWENLLKNYRLEFAFGRLSVRNARAPLLAQVGRDVLIGQHACRLTQARESIDSTRAGTRRRSHWAATPPQVYLQDQKVLIKKCVLSSIIKISLEFV